MSDKTKKGEALKREMERAANDEIKVYNPSTVDYNIRFGGRYWVVPNCNRDSGYGKGCLVIPRYIAKHYITHKVDELINEEARATLKKAKKEYKGTRWPEEELRIAPRTNNPTLRKNHIKKLWLGVVRKFGMDMPIQMEPDKGHDDRPLDLQILEDMEEIDLSDESNNSNPSVVGKKDTLEQEIAA